MIRWRKKSFPGPPRSLAAFGDLLQNIHDAGILEYNRGRLRTETLQDTDGNSRLFYDMDFIRADLIDARTLIVDATFDCIPHMDDCYQLFTIMVIKFSHVSLSSFLKQNFV